ncbi:hypothetical protein [Micromonospora sp. RTP1Z1]|uniref:hypothetical protein n=1 Tax=Micromonospora sp. RTP1Z1 TaxID=2994043 RepID=UPI0029C69D5B|nr:hypothetical protein [Micromonospora sp. RTP1Z1]
MRDQYQVTLYDPADVDAFSGDPDELYWTLDGLTPADNPTARIESISTSGRFIEVTVRGDASLMIRYRESDAADIHHVDEADILAAHQAIMACLSRAHEWRQALDPISGSFRTADLRIDYQQTGLSTANAMLDNLKRRQRRNLPKVVPPTILWGSRTITTGDTWHGVPGSGKVAVRILRPDRVHEHGIAIFAPGGTLTVGPAQSARETVIWPTADTAEIVVDYIAPAQTLQVCNVYMVRNGTSERVDRWSENAGMVIEPAGELERIYHCNHASTAPPGFADLMFSLRLLAGS